LIEAKASGLSAAQEIRRMMRDGEWRTVTVEPEGSKVARMHSVVPMLSGGLVYAPYRNGYPFLFAGMVIEDCAQFPKGQSCDIADSVSMALRWLRKQGLAKFPDELDEDRRFEMMKVGLGPAGDGQSLHYDI
jgi:phage terminase large subunit-like protein